MPRHGPGQLAAQLGEGVLAVGREFLDAFECAAQLAYQFLQAALLILETVEFLARFFDSVSSEAKRAAAAIACRLQFDHLAALLLFQRREPLFFLREIGIQRVELGDVAS